MRGFDFLSVRGTGRTAQLVINEVKAEAGEVASRRFTAFGLGSGGQRTFDQAVGRAREAILRADLDQATREALIEQLANRTVTVRLIGAEQTVFTSGNMAQIQAATRFSNFERAAIVVGD